MPIQPRRLLLALLVLVVGLVNLAGRHHAPPADAGTLRLGASADTIAISDAQRQAQLRFGPDVAPADRAWIEQAIAAARPEARGLIAEVDGLVTIDTRALGPLIMGSTRPGANGFEISLNTVQLDGERAIDRNVVVLHELGHVIDFALIDAALDRQLDAGIPRPDSCGGTGGPTGACAPAEERIADTFAKWALGGAVSAVGAGYQIPVPASLEDWGSPLGALAARLAAGPS
ncbi:MAG: hypothetical protein QOK21_968 [Solirubrobacteraceae bacterium]|jgi:hypothetical protein|nr:hypothetical protein [Solirubrobacteraceae bacterium]